MNNLFEILASNSEEVGDELREVICKETHLNIRLAAPSAIQLDYFQAVMMMLTSTTACDKFQEAHKAQSDNFWNAVSAFQDWWKTTAPKKVHNSRIVMGLQSGAGGDVDPATDPFAWLQDVVIPQVERVEAAEQPQIWTDEDEEPPPAEEDEE